LTGGRASWKRFLAARWLALPILVGASLLTWLCFGQLKRELAPLEDRGRLRVTATAPEGASFDYMLAFMDRLTERVAEETPEAEVILTQTAPGFGGGGVNSGWVGLSHRRSERDRSQSEIAQQLQAATRAWRSPRGVIQMRPSASARAASRLPVAFVIQAQLRETATLEVSRTGQRQPSLLDGRRRSQFNKPELRVEIDRERAQSLGVSARDGGESLNLALAEQRFGYFFTEGKPYDVLGAWVREQRDESFDLRTFSSRAATARR
jgi:multidrug efflux pump subunit AcrB